MNLLPVTMGEKGFAFGDGSLVDARPALKNAATFCFRPEMPMWPSRERSTGALTLAAEVEAVEPVGARASSIAQRWEAASSCAFRPALAKPGDRLRVIARPNKLHCSMRSKRTG